MGPPAKKFLPRSFGPGVVIEGKPALPYFTAVNEALRTRIHPGTLTICPVPPGLASALGFFSRFEAAGPAADTRWPADTTVVAATRTLTASTRARSFIASKFAGGLGAP